MRWKNVDNVINQSLDWGFPGGQLIVSLGNKKEYQRAFGSAKLIQSIPFNDSTHIPLELAQEGRLHQGVSDARKQNGPLITERGALVTDETLFDIASLTKVFATTYLFLKYAEHDPNLLNRTISEFFDVATLLNHKKMVAGAESIANMDFADIVGAIPIKALLSHHAGFEPNPLFYDPHYSETLYCQNRAQFLKSLLQSPLRNMPETIGLYSDVDFMLLSFILEKIGGAKLDAQLRSIFWEPLKLSHICYQPLLHGFSKDQIAATERNGNSRDGLYQYPNIRTEMIQGEVQDEKAYYCMEGISGHAGLFSNADDLWTLFQLMIKPNSYFSETLKAQFLTPCYSEPTFGLGFRLNGPDMRYMFGDFAGRQLGKRAFGHTGWTGCLATYDPLHELSIIYLTNRKNTPVCNPAQNPHLFYGDQLPAGKYLNIIHAIYHDLGISH